VTDPNTNPVPGVTVEFELTGIGDETIEPLEALTDANGIASTTLTTGIRAATIRVFAKVDVDGDGAPDLTAQSIAVAVLGAPPVQSRFSIAAERLNVAGRRVFGIRNEISAFVNDRFGNAVPPGTAVTFVSNGASVVNPTTTDEDGVATATLITENSIPPTGIVTVLAFTRGEEEFLDNNGNGTYESEVDEILLEDIPEPFVDFRPLPTFLSPLPPNDADCLLPAPSSLCNGLFDPDRPFELFVDLPPKDGVWGVQGMDGVWDDNVIIFDVIPVTFSGTLVTPVASPSEFTIPDGGSQSFTLVVRDDLFNPLVGGATVSVSAPGAQLFGGNITVPDGESFNQLVDGLNQFTFILSDPLPGEDPPLPPVTVAVVVTVTSENGDGTFIVASGTVD
jgi:hypothetical protein